MKIHFKGIYKGKDGELDYLEKYCETEHKPGAVKLPETEKHYYLKGNIFLGIIFALFSFLFCLRYPIVTNLSEFYAFLLILAIFSVLNIILIPVHEILHTVFNKQDSFIYFYPKRFSMFVINTEDKSKSEQILFLLFPSLVLGIIPFVVGLIFPSLKILSVFAIPGIAAGAGDYINIFYTLRHIPNGARIYTYKDGGDYWYKPE